MLRVPGLECAQTSESPGHQAQPGLWPEDEFTVVLLSKGHWLVHGESAWLRTPGEEQLGVCQLG